MPFVLLLLHHRLQENGKPGHTGCVVLVTFYNYFSVTNFFWMLVEGGWEKNGLLAALIYFLLRPCRTVPVYVGGGDLLRGQYEVQNVRWDRLG